MLRNEASRLIIERLSGHIKAEDDIVLTEWINSSEENKQFYDSVKLLWLRSPEKLSHPDPQSSQEWLNLKAVIHATEKNYLRPAIRYDWTAAAILIVGAAIALFYLAKSNAGMTIFRSEQSTITFYLPDSSKVWMNTHSEIKYPTTGFGKSKRVLYLKGEAYFSVRPDTTSFIVITTRGAATAVGTEFNVRETDAGAIVSVTEGKVSVETSETSQTLQQGEAVVMSTDQKLLEHPFENNFTWRGIVENAVNEEQSNPLKFLVIRKNDRKNLVDQTIVEGVVENHAASTGYHNIVAQVIYTKTNGTPVSQTFTIPGRVKQGKHIPFRIKLRDVFSKKKVVTMKLITAESH